MHANPQALWHGNGCLLFYRIALTSFSHLFFYSLAGFFYSKKARPLFGMSCESIEIKKSIVLSRTSRNPGRETLKAWAKMSRPLTSYSNNF